MTLNRKFTKCLLVMALILAAVFPASAFAATGDVISIDIEGSSSGIELTVGKTTKQLKVWATVEGTSTKRDVTGVVEWSSSDSEVVKVLNGVVTPLKSGTAVIKAMYNGSAVSIIEVRAVDSYKELKLEYFQSGKYVLGDEEAQLQVAAIAFVNNTTPTLSSKDVTKDATWSSSNSSVLTIDQGIIKLIGEGSATITAKYAGLTGSFSATVSSPYSKLKLYEGNATAPAKDIELVVGDNEIQLNAQSTLASDQSTVNVSDKATWSSSDTAVATVEEGKLKALAIGKTTITAVYLGVRAQVDVYVRAPYEAILLDPSSDQMLFIGEKLNVTAEMRKAANISEPVTTTGEWTSSNQLAVTVSSGEIAAKASGAANVKVSHLGISKSLKVTVYPSITKWVTEKTKLDMYKGESLATPKVKATKLDGEDIDFSKEVVWTSSNEEVATVEDGKIVAKGQGTVTLSAKLPESNATNKLALRSESVNVELTVKEKVLTLLVPVEKLNVVIGEDTALPEVTAVWEDGSEAVITSDVEWTLSGSNGVIKSGEAGKVIKGLTKGSATLKGTYSNKTITIPVTFEQKITKIVVEPSTIQLNIKKSKSIKVIGHYKDGTTVTLSNKVGWISSNTEVAAVSKTSVKAVAEGTATLSGSYQGQNISVKVNVVPKLTSLTVNEKTLTLAPGASKALVLTAAYDTGKTSSVAGSAVWTSSKTSVATVTDGKIVAVAKGSTSIKAKFGGKTVTIRVTVK